MTTFTPEESAEVMAHIEKVFAAFKENSDRMCRIAARLDALDDRRQDVALVTGEIEPVLERFRADVRAGDKVIEDSLEPVVNLSRHMAYVVGRLEDAE